MIGVSLRVELLGNNVVAVFRKPMISLVPVRSHLRIGLDRFLRRFDQRLAPKILHHDQLDVLRTTQGIVPISKKGVLITGFIDTLLCSVDVLAVLPISNRLCKHFAYIAGAWKQLND